MKKKILIDHHKFIDQAITKNIRHLAIENNSHLTMIAIVNI